MSDMTLNDMPTLRAQVGYVLKHATVHQGEWTPSEVFWLLEANGCVEYDDAPDTIETVKDVMRHSNRVEWGGE